MGRLLFLLFMIVPIIEIALFILLGQTIGLVPTLLGVVVTAVVGSAIIRFQGVSLLTEIRTMTSAGQLPGRQIAEGIMLAVAGALLLTPGYFTDLCGFLLLVPVLRQALYQFLASRISVVEVHGGTNSYQQRSTRPDTIDLDNGEWRDDDN